MRTGRRRKKQAFEEEKAPETKKPPVSRPKPATKPPRSPLRPGLIPLLILIGAFIALVIGIIVCGGSCFRPRASTYLPATAEGSWQATVNVLVPQTVRGEGWRSDCESDPD
jgi:hypothetical protein